MRRILAMIMAMLMMLSLCACGNTGTAATEAPDDGSFRPEFPTELRRYIGPWQTDVSEDAKQDGKLHYYFMASRAMLVDLTAPSPYKWGDACLIVFPNGETMLVDAGHSAYAPVLLENLYRMGVEKLDYFVITHPHAYHCLGAITEGTLFDSVEIGEVLWNGVEYETISEAIETHCREKEIPLRVLKKGDSMEIGGVKIDVLWPLPGTEGKELVATEDVDNTSLVLRFAYGTHTALFAGDVDRIGGKLLAEDAGELLDVDLLKVPCHGYGDTVSEELLAAVTPKVAVATGYLLSEWVKLKYDEIGATYLYDMYDTYVHVEADSEGMAYDTIWTRPVE